MSNKVTVRTNNHWRQFKYRYEVPDKVLESEFDYHDAPDELDDYHDGYLCYLGCWYHIDQFTVCSSSGTLGGFEYDATLAETAFSGVLIKANNDGDQYKIARFYS